MGLAAAGTRTRGRRSLPTRRCRVPTGEARVLDTNPRHTRHHSDQLSSEEHINAQIFRTSLRALASDVQYRTYEAPFNSDPFFWTDFTPRQGLATAAAYRSYLALPVLEERMKRFIAEESATQKQ